MDQLVQFYFEQGLSSSTHKTYATGTKRFNNFCISHNIVAPFPLSQSLLCYYVAYLAKQGLTPATINVYLSALRHEQIAIGYPEPAHSAMPKLKVVSNGVARAQAKSAAAVERTRLPISPLILRQLKSLWSPTRDDPNTIMLWAACTMAFFEFFRLGEITVPSEEAFDPSTHLTPSDIAIDDRDNPTLVQVYLKVSKTDQGRKGISIFLGETRDDLCPVAAISAFLAIRGSSAGPFFQLRGSAPLTKEFFTTRVRSALSALGYDSSLYASHSFRIGAATTAAEKGIEDTIIKALGRWKSDAFQAYVKIPRARLASFTAILSAPATSPATIPTPD